MFEIYSSGLGWAWLRGVLKSKQRWRALIIFLLILFSIISFTLISVAIFTDLEFSVPLFLFLLIAASVSISIVPFLHKSWQRAQELTGQELLEDDTRKPILYLRPFKSEKVRFYTPMSSDSMNSSVPIEILHKLVGKRSSGSAEEFFVGLFKELGPVVAIGRPGEKIPPLGAIRLYAGNDWKNLFVKLLDQAQMTLLFAGTSENFRWEMEQVFQHEPFVPTLLLMPYFQGVNSLRSLEKRRKKIDRFRAIFNSVTGIMLPDGLEYCRLIYFRDPFLPEILFDSGEESERKLNMLNPFLGPISKVIEERYPGWTRPYLSQSMHFNPDGGRSAKIDIMFALFVIVVLFLPFILFAILLSFSR